MRTNDLSLRASSVRALICLMSLCVSAPAFAQPPVPSHQDLSPAEQQVLVDLIDGGQTAFDAGDFDGALAQFQKAYALFPHPDLKYRIARCHEYLGELPEAIAAYQFFLDATPQAEERGRIEKTIAQLTQRHRQTLAATLQMRVTPPDANVFVDSERIPNPSSNRGHLTVELAPGAHEVRVEQRGYLPQKQVLELRAGEEKARSFTLQMTPMAVDEPSGTRSTTGPAVLGGLGVVAGVLGIYSYTQYASNREQIDIWDARKGDEARPARYDSTHDDMDTWATLTWTAGIVSAASLASAAIWWWGFRDDGTSQSGERSDDAGVSLDSVALTPRGAPSGAAAHEVWSFSLSGRF